MSDMNKNSEKEEKGDCYAEGERKFMDWNQSLRGRVLHSFLEGLDDHGVTPNTVTVFSMLSGLMAALFLPFIKIMGLIFL